MTMRGSNSSANATHLMNIQEESIRKENSISRGNSRYKATPGNNFNIPIHPQSFNPTKVRHANDDRPKSSQYARTVLGRKQFSIQNLNDLQTEPSEDVLIRPATSNQDYGQFIDRQRQQKKHQFEQRNKKECNETTFANIYQSTIGKSPFVHRNAKRKNEGQ